MNMLMNGVNPVGMVYNQSAENIAYDSNNSVKDMLKVETVYTTTGLTILRCGNIVMYDFTGYTAKNNDAFPYTPPHNVRGVLTDTLRVVIGSGKIELISNGSAVTTNTNLYGSITAIEY